MKLQTITSDLVIENLTQLGRDIQGFCNIDDNIHLFPSHGFNDGGCLAFAIGIQDWLGIGDLVVFTTDDLIQHFAVKVDELYIDGHGIASEQEFIQKMVMSELDPNLFYSEAKVELLEDWENKFGLYDQDESGILDYTESSIPDEITIRLNRQIGFRDQITSILELIQEDAIHKEDNLQLK
jgi:hypothetical protein